MINQRSEIRRSILSNKSGKRAIRIIDSFIIFGSLFVIMWAIRFSNPLVIAPIDNYESLGGNILFSIENADLLIIDTDINFTNSKEYNLNKNFSLSLEPNIYYWKVVGVRESEIRTLTIKDSVILNIVKGEKGYDVVNAGSVILNVEVYDNQSHFIENVTLYPEGKILSNQNKYIAGQEK